jgi:acyl-CoA thioesterase FadM
MKLGTVHLYEVDVTPELTDRGLLHHTTHLVLAEQARAAALDELGASPDWMWGNGCVLVVRGLTAEYRKPIFSGAKLLIVSEVTETSGSSLEFRQCLYPSHDLPRMSVDGNSPSPAGEVRVRLVFVNVAERRATALPAQLRTMRAESTPGGQAVAS